jgi:DNA-binding beta-propeller fold protein YncE
VALDTNCNLYVADPANNRVAKISPTGDTLAQWGTDGRGVGQFHRPRAVALGTPGADAGQTKQPRGVAVDTQGNVYVADTQNHRVEQVAADGTFMTQWRRCEDGQDQVQRLMVVPLPDPAAE